MLNLRIYGRIDGVKFLELIDDKCKPFFTSQLNEKGKDIFKCSNLTDDRNVKEVFNQTRVDRLLTTGFLKIASPDVHATLSLSPPSGVFYPGQILT